MQEGNVVDAGCQIRIQRTDPFTTLAVLLEFPSGLDEAFLVLVSAAAESYDVDRYAVHSDHGRFVIERVDVAWAAVHEKEDDALCLGRQQGRFGGERVRGRRGRGPGAGQKAFAGEQRGECGRAEPAAGFP